jgi:hypothetical protein
MKTLAPPASHETKGNVKKHKPVSTFLPNTMATADVEDEANRSPQKRAKSAVGYECACLAGRRAPIIAIDSCSPAIR